MWTLVPECHSLTDLRGKHSLFPLGAISHTDAAVVGHPGQVVSAGGEGDAMHPPTAVFLLQQNLSERHLGPPDCGSGLFLNVLDVSWENPVKAQPHCFTFLLRVPQPTGIYCKLDFVVFIYKQLAWDWGPRVCCSHQKCSLKGAPMNILLVLVPKRTLMQALCQGGCPTWKRKPNCTTFARMLRGVCFLPVNTWRIWENST